MSRTTPASTKAQKSQCFFEGVAGLWPATLSPKEKTLTFFVLLCLPVWEHVTARTTGSATLSKEWKEALSAERRLLELVVHVHEDVHNHQTTTSESGTLAHIAVAAHRRRIGRKRTWASSFFSSFDSSQRSASCSRRSENPCSYPSHARQADTTRRWCASCDGPKLTPPMPGGGTVQEQHLQERRSSAQFALWEHVTARTTGPTTLSKEWKEALSVERDCWNLSHMFTKTSTTTRRRRAKVGPLPTSPWPHTGGGSEGRGLGPPPLFPLSPLPRGVR